MKLIGKFIKEEWKHNEGYRSTWLRRIDRETKTQYISNCNRHMKPRTEPTLKYFPIKWGATRYPKTKDGFIRTQNTNLSNPDGHTVLTVVEDFNKDLLCKYTYEELFETDLRELQKGLDKEANPLKMKLWKVEKEYFTDSKTWDEDKYFQLGYRLANSSDDVVNWNRPLIEYLEEMFGLPVFNIWDDKVREHNTQGKLCKSATLMHVNHFGGVDNKLISSEDSYHNRTIMFWLFNDKLVFQYEDGKESW